MLVVSWERKAMETPPVVAVSSVSGHHMQKNCLHAYAQRSGISVPFYSTFNEGPPHVPRFRGTVLVDGMTYTSPNTFSHRKDAEQDVAKLALEGISAKLKNEASHFIHKDPVFCKLILNEYGAKLKIDKPTYNTTEQRGILPMFITSTYFDGKSYVGFPGKNKKEAEQNAACAVIDAILANTYEANTMAQIIKAKGRLYAAVGHGVNVGNAARRIGTESNGANDVDREPEVVAISTSGIAISTSGSLPVGSTSCVPCTSWVDVDQSNQVNYQIPTSGLPVAAVDSQTINTKKRNKQSKKKRKGEKSKKIRVEEPSTSMNPVKGEQED